ncbi:MAG: hypothetical protein JWP35_4672 [Caulobacter sp.]|nr:hypothetical protein [Caulobacter sp.]
MIIEAFQPAHLQRLVLQPEQQAWQGKVTDGHAEVLGSHGVAWTGFDGDQVLGCAGILDRGEGRGLAWALLAEDVGPRRFVTLHRAVARGFEILPYRRIEAHVSPTFQQGIDWAQMLGFQFEGVMRAYLPTGDLLLFARIR